MSNSELRSPNCDTSVCPWRKYRHQQIASASPSPFDVYEDSTFQLQDKEWPLYCRPDVFGYSNEEGEEIFPHQNYPGCLSKFPHYEPAMFIINDTLLMNCSGPYPGKYVLGDRSYNSTVMLPASFTATPKLYTGPVPLLKGEEWALGTCDEHNENLFEQISIRVKPNAGLFMRLKAKTKAVLEEANRKFQGSSKHKMIIMLLTVDSASRRHFYRKFPLTLAYLQRLNGHKYHVADFLMHNIIGDNSARNQIPVLSGEPRLVNKSIKELEGTQEALMHGDGFGNRSILKFASDRGFVTMLSFEFCHQYFATYMGDHPYVHHLMANFWCGAKKYAGFNFEKSVLGQRCIGPQMSHVHMLDYISQFTEAYMGLNQLIYTHITTGHEASGTQIQTLDVDLRDFLMMYLAKVEIEGYEVAILLHGDHGMRYGEWYKNIAAFQEHRLPALFTISSMSLMDRLDGSYEIIEHNRKRLVGKLDLYLTVKSFVLASFLPTLSRVNNIYQSWKTNALTKSVSLVLNKIPNMRSCWDVFIPSFYCACMKMELIEPSIYTQPLNATDSMKDLRIIIDSAVDFSLLELNAAEYTGRNVPRDHICQHLTLKGVNSVYAQRVSARDEAFKIEFSVNEHATARFETYSIVGVTPKHVEIKENQEGLLPVPGFFRGRKKRLRILFLKRLDSYSGFCEEMAFSRGINSPYCVCHPAAYLHRSEPALFDHLVRDLTFLIGPETGFNCSSVCEAKDLKCDSAYFELLTDTEYILDFLQRTQDSNMFTCIEGNFTGVRKTDQATECVVARSKQTCSASPIPHFSLVCPCR